MKLMSKITLICAAICLTAFIAKAQDDGLIYGTVETIDGEKYQGQIRWGKEEAFWTDLFNGNKEDNDNYRHLSRRDKDDLRERSRRRNGRWSWSSFSVRWGDRNDYETTHEFQCRFGDIQKIDIRRRSEVELTLRNGETLYIESGSNDFGGNVVVMDSELGKTSFKWSRIENITFAETPRNLDSKLGEPLYGKVTFYGGEYTGFVQWDHDERLSTDKLDGDTRDGDLSIEFGKIRSISPDGSGSDVVLKSGRELYLRGSNDVNRENRGIIVTTDFGRVDIPWREFKGVEFMDAPNSGKGYSTYANVGQLEGTVTTANGQTLTGRIVYDLDEEYGFEMLQGKDDDVEYILPMESIKKIIPRNYENSNIILRNGKEIMLGESRDVSEDNDGILVFTGNGDPEYVRWEDVKEIEFK